MLGRSAACKIIYVRPVGGTKNTWKQGEDPNTNDLAWPPSLVIFFFPYTPPIPTNPPPAVPPDWAWFRSISAPFGSVSGPFGSVWLRFGSVSGPFRVRFGVLGGVGVGSGRGASVREKNIPTLVPRLAHWQPPWFFCPQIIYATFLAPKPCVFARKSRGNTSERLRNFCEILKQVCPSIVTL